MSLQSFASGIGRSVSAGAVGVGRGIGRGTGWLFAGSRPLKIFAALCLAPIVGSLLIYAAEFTWNHTQSVPFTVISVGLFGLLIAAMASVRRWRFPDITGIWLLKAADKGVFATYVGSVGVVYVLDMIFFGSIAGDNWALWPVFIAFGLVLRTGAVASGVFLQKFKGVEGYTTARLTVRAIWLFCVAACLLSALNFFAAGHADKGIDAIMGKEVAQAQIDTKDSRITTINGQIAGIRADRDAAIAEARASIDAIKDEVDGMSAADNASVQKLQDDISKYQADARADILEKERQIAAIETAQATNKIDLTVNDNTADTWEVFIWLGDHTWWDSDQWSNGGLFFLAMLLEAIAALGLGAYADLHGRFVRIIAQLEIDEEIREIQHGADLNRARIEATALARRVAREAEAQARELAREDPEYRAAAAALGFLGAVLAASAQETPPTPPAPPEKPPATPPPPPANDTPDKPEDKGETDEERKARELSDRMRLLGRRGNDSKRLRQLAMTETVVLVGDRLCIDLPGAAE